MGFSLDSSRRYEFKLIYNVIDTTKTWNWDIRDSSLDDYDDDGRIIYQIVGIGVDSTGFYYKWNTYNRVTIAYGHASAVFRRHGTSDAASPSVRFLLVSTHWDCRD